ncbi:unnamed protein product, partial [Sphacelaria rigidula]
IYDALFPAEEAETLSAVLGRDEEIREKNAQREALKRQHFEDYMTERRRGEIEEIEEAYVAGLADMSPPEERSAANAGPTVVDWRSDGGVG